MEGKGFEVADGVHRIEAPMGERFVACYLVVGEAAALLVDTGVATSPEGSIVPYARSIGLEPGRIRWAVISHCDVDHMGGDAALARSVPGVTLVAHEADRPLIEDVGRIVEERYREFAPDHDIDIDTATVAWCHEVAAAAPVGLALRGEAVIDLGGRRVEVLHTPGHSHGSISVWDERTRAAITSDAVLGASVRLADGRPAFPPTYRYVAEYRATIADLERRGPAWLLMAHEPVMDAAAARAFLAESRGFADRLEGLAIEELREGPRSLRELIETLAPRMGPWDRPAWDSLAYGLLGHLEDLEVRGLVQRLPGRPARWRLTGQGGAA